MVKLRFHRNKKMLYLLVFPEVYVDGELIRTLKNGETYEYDVEEGEHEITVIAQIATIKKHINIQHNMDFNIELHANSFDLDILEDEKKWVEDASDNTTNIQNNYGEKKSTGTYSAKNDYKNKSYWKNVLLVVAVSAVVSILSRLIIG